jgi:hypothetical protein
MVLRFRKLDFIGSSPDVAAAAAASSHKHRDDSTAFVVVVLGDCSIDNVEDITSMFILENL